MGTWSTSPFGNDSSGDLLADCEEEDPVRVIEEALETAAGATEELEAPEGEEAYAAAGILAVVNRAKIDPGFNEAAPFAFDGEEVVKLVGKLSLTIEDAERLAPLARRALDRIVDSEISELADLWEDSSDKSEWLAQVAAVRAGLPGA